MRPAPNSTNLPRIILGNEDVATAATYQLIIEKRRLKQTGKEEESMIYKPGIVCAQLLNLDIRKDDSKNQLGVWSGCRETGTNQSSKRKRNAGR